MIEKAVWVEAEQTDPYINLAIEQQLMKAFSLDTAVLYLWQNQHTVVIGRNQDPWAECRAEEFMADGGRIARRLSGGGAVYHDLGNLNYTFIVPREEFDIERQMKIILQAVASFGLNPCMSGRNDLIIDGRKFSGNAFQIQEKTACHHGTLLVNTEMMAANHWLTADKSKLANHKIQSVASRIVNLSDLCPEMDIAGVKRSLLNAFSRAYGLSPVRIPQTELDYKDIENVAVKFSSREWLFPEEKPLPDVKDVERFSWGSLHIQLWIKEGNIQCAALSTDALEMQLFPMLERALRQVRWDGKSIRCQVETKLSGLLSDEQFAMMEDVLKWLEKL